MVALAQDLFQVQTMLMVSKSRLFAAGRGILNCSGC